jgi:hypothetical protein
VETLTKKEVKFITAFRQLDNKQKMSAQKIIIEIASIRSRPCQEAYLAGLSAAFALLR